MKGVGPAHCLSLKQPAGVGVCSRLGEKFKLAAEIPLTKWYLMTPLTLHGKCLYSELFWSAFSHIWTEYCEILCISTYSVWMPENADQNNSEYGHFLRSAWLINVYSQFWNGRGMPVKVLNILRNLLWKLFFVNQELFYSLKLH